ncbi:hypothetical protein TNCV_4035401 [Trichonephila clavipes]|nr:hypothetical protein TNCV_4035401 [Trichonephila clavipes]
MSARHFMSDYDYGGVVERLEAGQSVTTVAAAMGVSKSVISPFKKSTWQKGTDSTPGRIAANLATATGTHISARTISRWLNQVGLYAWKPVCCTLLQPRHRRERLRWSTEHVSWDPQN